jgi:serine/threonine protein kinase
MMWKPDIMTIAPGVSVSRVTAWKEDPREPRDISHTLIVFDLAPGSTFAGCRIEGVAGRGGMGVVYRATQLALGRTVALKLIAPERAADTSFHARFERESRMAAAIDHPNVIPVYGAGEDDGRLYLLMRWVQGTDLQALIAGSHGLAPARAVAIVAQVGAGLDAAHAAGLVHRDVKPANVLIAGDTLSGHVYLSDFGLTLQVSSDTRLTESGAWIGTVDFMAPEQFDGERTDARTDVYGLGCLLYAALTGEAPFSRRTVAATMVAHLSEQPPRPSATAGVPAAFDGVVARALAKAPDDRYPSAGSLVSEALAANEDSTVGRPADSFPHEAVPGNGSANDTSSARTKSAATGVLPRTTIALPETGQSTAEHQPTARISRSRRRLTETGLLAVGAAVFVALFVAALAGEGPFGGGEHSGPLTMIEVRGAADAFARAYAGEDEGALARVLSRRVTRVTPSDKQRGRSAVLREYRRQFAANETEKYELKEVNLRAGAIARAEGRYVVSRSGGRPITGRIVLGVQRERGRPRIGLIAATPDR